MKDHPSHSICRSPITPRSATTRCSPSSRPCRAARERLPVTIADYAVIAVAVLLASCLQASIGFGIGMLAAPVVALVDPALIPGTLIMVATLVTLIVAVREREDIDLHGTGWALVGRVPGTIAGALLLAMLPERALTVLLAGVVLLGVALTSCGWIPVPRRRNVVLAGA